ncbi:hypothetical protein [Bradyrhizobium genosp. P]
MTTATTKRKPAKAKAKKAKSMVKDVSQLISQGNTTAPLTHRLAWR